jgi:hypothetical protein
MGLRLLMLAFYRDAARTTQVRLAPMLVDRNVDFVCCNNSTAFDAPDTYEESEAAKDASSAEPRDP